MSWLRRARQTAWASAVATLLAGGPLGPLGLLHAGFGDDPACSAALADAADSGPQLESSAPSAPAHCDACHWLHLLRSAPPAGGSVAPALVDAVDCLTNPDSAPVAVWPFTSSGRSPPSSTC